VKILKTKMSRNFLAAAWAYRKAARGHGFMNGFSLTELSAMFNYETYGKKKFPEPDKSVNGFAYGKWLMDLTVAMWKEELKTGLFGRLELMQGTATHYKKILADKNFGPAFPVAFYP
jgi:hypothetical protein